MTPRTLKISLLTAVVLLLALNAYLLHSNNQYRQQNRTLILQNDSILSVNLELKQSYQNRQSTALTGD